MTTGIADRYYLAASRRRDLIAQRAVCLDIMADMRRKIAAGSTIWTNMLAEYERTMPSLDRDIEALDARIARLDERA